MFRIRMIISIVALSILMLFIITGCASFVPRPANSEDTLLLVPIRMENTSGYDVDFPFFYRFLITKDKFEKWIEVPMDREFVTIPGLEPGEYRIVKLWVVNSTSTYTFNLPVTLKSGKASLFPFELFIQFYRNTEDMKYYQKVNFVEMDFKKKYELVEKLKKYKNFDLWEFDYSSGTAPVTQE